MGDPRTTPAQLYRNSSEVLDLERRVTLLELKFGANGSVGPSGPPGPAGATGPIGPPGASGLSVYDIPPTSAFADSPVPVTSSTGAATLYLGDASGGDIVFNLPACVGSGQIVGFLKLDDSTNALKPTAAAGDSINFEADYTLNTRLSIVWMTDAGANGWLIVNATPLA